MKNKFVADGYRRFMRAKKTASLEAIEKKYAPQLAEADPVQQHQIRKQMVEEYLAQKNLDHKPSAGTLW
jgi:hypothetical protein